MFWWILLNVYAGNTNNACSLSALANNVIYYQVHYVVFLFDVKWSLRVKFRQNSHLRLFCSSPTLFFRSALVWSILRAKHGVILGEKNDLQKKSIATYFYSSFMVIAILFDVYRYRARCCSTRSISFSRTALGRRYLLQPSLRLSLTVNKRNRFFL